MQQRRLSGSSHHKESDVEHQHQHRVRVRRRVRVTPQVRVRPPVVAPGGRAAWASVAVLAVLASLFVGAAFPAVAAAAPSGSVSIVAYSTPKPAYAALIKAFKATKAGQGVTFSQSLRRRRAPRPPRSSTACRPTSSTSPRAPTCRSWSRPGSSRPCGAPGRPRAWSPTRSCRSSCARATPSTSPRGPDLVKSGSRSSPRTRSARAAPSGT